MATKKKVESAEDIAEKARLQYNESNRTLVCEICSETISVGYGGLGNYRKVHKNSPKCLKAKERKEKAETALKKPKNGSLLSFLKKAKAPHPSISQPSSSKSILSPFATSSTPSSSTTQLNSAPETSPPSASPAPFQIALPEPASTDDDTSAIPSDPYLALKGPSQDEISAMKDRNTPVLSRLRLLVTHLPPTVPVATEADELAQYAEPRRFDDPSIAGDDLWEQVLNSALKRGLGWGGDIDVDVILRRGKLGVEGLLGFVEYFVEERGVSEGLFEGKLGLIMDGMLAKILNAAQHVKATVAEPTIQGPEHIDIEMPAAPTTTTSPSDATLAPDVEILEYTPAIRGSVKHQCPGYHLPMPENCTPHTSYPFGLHSAQHLPWNYFVQGDKMFLIAHDCQKTFLKGDTRSACKSCHSLAQNSIIRGIRDRMNNGAHINMTFAYLGFDELVLALKNKTDQNQFLRFNALNQARSLERKKKGLSMYQRLTVAIASKDIPRVARVIHAGLQRRKGIAGILEKVTEAAQGVYKVKSFSENERMLGTLLWRIGGARVGHILHRALGLPSVGSLRNASVRIPVQPSAGMPTAAEVSKNALNMLEGVIPIIKNDPNVRHAVLMFDELAVERRPRYNQRTNELVGACLEHAHEIALKFETMGDVEEFFRAVDDGDVHLASEATIAGVGILSKENRLYSSRIVLISADCKKETGSEHARVLQTVVNGLDDIKATTNLRIVSIASDGEARRGSALVELTFKRELSENSNIYPLLHPLRLLDLHVGDDDLTCDKDWKHVFKRFRNLLLREQGVLVDGFRITPSVIKKQLESTKSKEHINSVANPNDLQDVKLAFDLLHDIWSLPSIPTDDEDANPGFRAGRDALVLLGKLLHHLVYAYVCVDLDLDEQLEHLSAAAHLLFVLYKTAGKEFIPTQLYIDIILMIKNVFFSVAKAKVDTPHACFFIIQLGTDRLEIHFGILRTVVGNDCNLDVLQISDRTGGLVEIADILSQRPDWDQGPRRMQIPTLSKQTGDVPEHADHLSPQYLRGNYAVANVTLLTCWRRGRARAEAEYPPAIEILKEADKDKSINLLAPAGALLVNIPLGEDDLDESSEHFALNATADPSDPAPETSSLHTDTADPAPETSLNGTTSEAQVDIEDVIETTETNDDLPHNPTTEESSETQVTAIPSHSILVNGKIMRKSKVVAMFSRYRKKVTSWDRLKRVQEMERYQSAHDQGTEYGSDTRLLLIHDPIATLIYSDSRLWLAVGEVNGIKFAGKAIDRIGHSLLKEKAAKISFQLVGLQQVSVDDARVGSDDWRTYKVPGTSYELPGRCVEILSPEFSLSNGKSSYLLDTQSLAATASALVQRLSPSDLKAMPKRSPTLDYPYRERGGKACFLAEVKEDDLVGVAEANLYTCTLCRPPVTLEVNAQRVLKHMGAHILFDPAVNRLDYPCSLCLLPSRVCKYYIARGKGANGSWHVDGKRTTGCTRKINFQYRTAESSTDTAPCSNVPIRCPLCPDEPSIWRYNLRQHFVGTHSTEAAAQYQELWEIGEDERTAMRFVWDKRQPKGPKCAPRKKAGPTLVASKQHSSSIALSSNANNPAHNSNDDSSAGSMESHENLARDEATSPNNDADDDDDSRNETWQWRLPSVEPGADGDGVTDSEGKEVDTGAELLSSMESDGVENSMMVVGGEEEVSVTSPTDQTPPQTTWTHRRCRATSVYGEPVNGGFY
ncbi:hypothetical protein DFP72DRAFT_1135958 [Ephemerocybe angulata]|uniref:Uncharacterized protein n=1 Tax=Ephemerocybe angulata TaxID=980116 RepID=A0A8H6HR01_9AGAR|nr:hypothetical protein DFP72DRAFT_1135958 [Tulosesus angulatus]